MKGKKYTLGLKMSDDVKNKIKERMLHFGNPSDILVINMQNGIYYKKIKEAANIYSLDRKKLSKKLHGKINNETSLRLA